MDNVAVIYQINHAISNLVASTRQFLIQTLTLISGVIRRRQLSITQPSQHDVWNELEWEHATSTKPYDATAATDDDATAKLVTKHINK